MKTLPEFFVIKRDASNPLWEKYIKWLNDKYCCKWKGNIDEYLYGYDGNNEYNGGTNYWACVQGFQNSPVLITLEYWNEAVNGEHLPEKWAVKRTEENHKILNEYFNKRDKSELKENDFFLVTPIYSGYSAKEYIIPEGYTEITFEQFKRLVMKEQRKCIGYKLKDECKKYISAILSISKTGDKNIDFDRLAKEADAFAMLIQDLQQAGVLDLWFDKVYEEEPKFKKGEWVIVGYNTREYLGVYDRTENIGIYANEYRTLTEPTHVIGNGKFDKVIRHATPAEIEAAKKPKLPKINSYEGKIEGDYVVYGCTKESTDTVKELYHIMKAIGIESIKVKGVTITMSEIESIVKVINHTK